MSPFKKLAAATLIATVVSGTYTTVGTSARATQAASSEIVQYRLESWKTAHVHGNEQTEQLVGTLKKMRCEVKLGSHGGHTDVTYRCPKWQQMSLSTHKAAHQWETWLKKYGFETKHVH